MEGPETISLGAPFNTMKWKPRHALQLHIKAVIPLGAGKSISYRDLSNKEYSMNITKQLTLFLSLISITLIASASPVQLDGTVDVVIPFNHKANKLQGVSTPQSRDHIKLLKLKLTDKARHALMQRVEKNSQKRPAIMSQSAKKTSFPQKINLGMNNVPVLYQGHHGSCVTFAVTAAIDAIIGKGDYISQLCLLELGSSISKVSYYPSGWDGSWGRNVFNMLTIFGAINTENQHKYSCGGLTNYPIKDKNTSEMNETDYKAYSEDLSDKFTVKELLTIEEFIGHVEDAYDGKVVLNNVKAALNKGDRVAFGTALVANLGVAGAMGQHTVANDTWLISDEIEQALKDPNIMLAGHEMVIYGYDDNAISVDAEGKEHKGLLRLRNSWSEYIGDKGDFYMTYDYFRIFVLDASQLIDAKHFIKK